MQWIHRIPVITMLVGSPNQMAKYEPWCASTLVSIPFRSEGGLMYRGEPLSAYGETREKAVEALQETLRMRIEGNLKEFRIGIQTISVTTTVDSSDES